MRKTFLVLAGGQLPSLLGRAGQLVNSFYFIPVVTKAPGLTARTGRATITVTNVGPASVQVGTKVFYGRPGEHLTGSFPVNVWISPGQTTVLEDFFSIYARMGLRVPPRERYLVLADITPVNCNVSSPPTTLCGPAGRHVPYYNTGDPKGTYSTAAEMNLAGANFTTYPSIITGVRQTGFHRPGLPDEPLGHEPVQRSASACSCKILRSNGARPFPN